MSDEAISMTEGEKWIAEGEVEGHSCENQLRDQHRLDLADRFMAARLANGTEWQGGRTEAHAALRYTDDLLAAWAATNPGGEG